LRKDSRNFSYGAYMRISVKHARPDRASGGSWKEGMMEVAVSGATSHPVRPWLVPRGDLAGMVLLAAAVSLSLVSVFLLPLNWDAAWYLYVAERVLNGSRLYVDFVEINTPLIFYLSMPAALVTGLFQLPAVLVFKLYVVALAVISVLLTDHLLRSLLGPDGRISRQFLRVAIVLASLGILNYLFGEREHLLVLFTLPFLVAVAGRARGVAYGRRLMLIVGGLAALGLLLKPHFLLLWLLLEAYLGLKQGSRATWGRPEFAAVGVAGVLHAAWVWFVTPDYFSILWIPLASYGTFNQELQALLWKPHTVFVAAAVGASLLVRPSEPLRELRHVLMLAAAAMLLVAVYQQKGWNYHFYPAVAFALLLATVFMAEVFSRVVHPDVTGIARKAWLFAMTPLILLMGAVTVEAVNFSRSPDGRMFQELVHVTQEHARGEPIVVLSTEMGWAFPLVLYAGAEWSLRFPSLWALAGAYRNEEPVGGSVGFRSRNEMGRLERFVMDATVDDLVRHPPALILVEHSDNRVGPANVDFDFLDYFLTDQHFSALFADYRYLTQVGPIRFFKREAPTRSSSRGEGR
jgi:hypothetical protein